METEKKPKEIEIAENLVKKYGTHNFISNLCSRDLFVITKKKGMFSKPKETYIIISKECAKQIIMRHKLNQYQNLFEDTGKRFLYSNDLLQKINLKRLLSYIDKCYNSKRDDAFFDKKVQALVELLEHCISTGRNKLHLVCITADDDTTMKLYTLSTDIKKYFTNHIDDEIIL